MSHTPALLSVLLMLSLAACGSGSESGGASDGTQAATTNPQASAPTAPTLGPQAAAPEPEAAPPANPVAVPIPAPATPPANPAPSLPKAIAPEDGSETGGQAWFPGEPSAPGRRPLPETLKGEDPTPVGPSDGNPPTQPVPEPATVVLITLGALFVGFMIWRHQRDLQNALTNAGN